VKSDEVRIFRKVKAGRFIYNSTDVETNSQAPNFSADRMVLKVLYSPAKKRSAKIETIQTFIPYLIISGFA